VPSVELAQAVYNPHYDFNDDALAIGAAYWVNGVKAFPRAA
jgi:hypothetical protein